MTIFSLFQARCWSARLAPVMDTSDHVPDRIRPLGVVLPQLVSWLGTGFTGGWVNLTRVLRLVGRIPGPPPVHQRNCNDLLADATRYLACVPRAGPFVPHCEAHHYCKHQASVRFFSSPRNA